MISKRAQKFVSKPSAIMEGYIKCLDDPFTKQNTDGYLNFGIAENYLNDDLLLPKLNQSTEIKAEHVQYNSINGGEKIRELMANFFQKYLGLKEIDPTKIVINCGLSSLCESLSFGLFDEGDKILIATPYYTGFEHDFTKRFGCQFVPVHLSPEENFQHKIKYFEEAYQNHPDAKAVLICHPHNPTGEILSDGFHKDLIQFCLKNDLEVISDEIYALSNHNQIQHHSLYQNAVDAGLTAHFMYGMAKDFCLAGLKIGFYYTNDEEALPAIQANSYFYPVSSPSFLILENIFSDQKFLESYIPENQYRLQRVKQRIISELPEFDFIPGESAVFMLLDLSSYCCDFETEVKIHQLLLNQAKINLTPGSEMGTKYPGFFRICFTRDEEQVGHFIQRMQSVKSLL